MLQKLPNVRFVMAGSGDMIRRTIEMAAQMGIGQRVAFTGFLRGRDVDRVFEMADLYVMPSVSEPFGIAPLEALRREGAIAFSDDGRPVMDACLARKAMQRALQLGCPTISRP